MELKTVLEVEVAEFSTFAVPIVLADEKACCLIIEHHKRGIREDLCRRI
jgi:hypothetical protein